MVLRLYTFHFPGWRAYVDGAEAEIEVAHPEGFITVRVPEGQHDVVVRFEDTPPRVAAWLVSAAGLLALLGVLIVWRSLVDPGDGQARSACGQIPSNVDSRRTLVWMAGTVLCFAALKGLVIDPQDSWLRFTSPPGQALPAEREASVTFADQIELLGYDLDRASVRSGEEVRVVLYWHAIAPPASDYQSFVHLARPLHILWGQEDHLNPGDLPTRRWPLDKYVRDEYALQVLPGTPPGEYLINVGLYAMADGYRLATAGSGGRPAGDSVVISTLRVERPVRQPTQDDLDLTRVVDATFREEGVTLLGILQSRLEVGPTEPWSVALFWRADRDGPGARRRDLVLLDESSDETVRLTGVPGGSDPAHWLAGDVVRDPIIFEPAESVPLRPGIYSIAVQLGGDESVSSSDAADRLTYVGEVRVRAE